MPWNEGELGRPNFTLLKLFTVLWIRRRHLVRHGSDHPHLEAEAGRPGRLGLSGEEVQRQEPDGGRVARISASEEVSQVEEVEERR